MPVGSEELSVIKQRITTLKQLFTRKETRVLAATCTGHDGIVKEMLLDMNEKAIEILELTGKYISSCPAGETKVAVDNMEKLDAELSKRQIRCETHVLSLPVETPAMSTRASRQEA